MTAFDGIIRQLEAQKAAIDKALEALRGIDGTPTPAEVSAAPVGEKAAAKKAKNGRSEGQKKRWAAKKVAEAISAPVKVSRKTGMTEDGRKRLAEAMKKRWAAKRTAAQAKKRPGRTKKA